MGLVRSLVKMTCIIVPIMVALQLLKDYKILDKMAKRLSFISRFFNISQNSIFPLLVGFFIGISYGAGVIIESAESGNMSKKDTFLVVVFLITCHAVVEDSGLFIALGANGWILVSIRVIVAIMLTYIISRRYGLKERMNLKEIKEKA
ncbi:nucleoside recognition protein [Anaeromicrobium sediminis]|uniref:Nucleoside recognition protein n=2 Tax=Anaeromicrobium sediminis TaxID=1478221 RepID=A0A267MFA7_9FIRM|nr:nucleoside recognition protein [Anaeromicrobium sediminis]